MSKQKINYLSLASVISAFAVVMLHTNGVFWWFSTEGYWFSANIIESVLYFAVPVFFMISGATLIDYRERYTTKEYFKKRINKTFIPFVAWMLVGTLFTRLLDGKSLIPMEAGEWKETILNLINNKVIEVYWFFTPLFCVYLSIPLLSAIEKNIRIRVFQYLIAAALVFNIVFPFFSNIFSLGYTNYVLIDVADGYLFWIFVGYVLNKQTLEKKWRIISYVFGIIGLLIHMVGTYTLSMDAGAVVTLYKGYVSFPCVMYSIAIFIFIKEVGQKIKNQNIWCFVNWVGKYTFAIYLMHWFVMVVLQRLLDLNVYSIVYRLGFPVVVCGVCIFITWIMRKIPIVKKFVP